MSSSSWRQRLLLLTAVLLLLHDVFLSTSTTGVLVTAASFVVCNNSPLDSPPYHRRRQYYHHRQQQIRQRRHLSASSLCGRDNNQQQQHQGGWWVLFAARSNDNNDKTPTLLSSKTTTTRTARRNETTTTTTARNDDDETNDSTLSSILFEEQQQEEEVDKDDGKESSSTTTTSSLWNMFGNSTNSIIPSDVRSSLGLLLLSQFILFIGVGAVIPSIPLYGKEIGLSAKASGVVISAPAVASLLLSQYAGQYADIGRKPAMLYGMAIIILSDIGTALATTLPTLTIARLGLGTGRIVSESGERGMLADLAGRVPSLRGRLLSVQQSIIALGIAIGAPLGGYIIQQQQYGGPRTTFLCVSAAATITLAMYWFLPETINVHVNDVKDNDDCTNANDNENNKNDNVVRESSGISSVDRNRNDKNSSRGEWTRLLREDSQWRGLALCQVGTSCGFAAKIASIPILATDVLPGGAVGAGALLSAAGLSGLVGAPLGGWLTDQTNAKFTSILSGIISAIGLVLIPLALNTASIPPLLFGGDGGGNLIIDVGGDTSTAISLLGQPMSIQAVAFSIVVLIWSIGAAAQGPALTALAQELAPAGAEATAMALPRAAGDGTYIVAPFLLGVVSDMYPTLPGTDCAVAGVVGLLGVLALALLGGNGNNDE